MISRARLYPEYLLLLPALLYFIDEVVYGNGAIDIHLHDTYFVIKNNFFFVVVFVFYWLFFCMHFTLRSARKRNRYLCNAHVYGTVLLHLLLFAAGIFREEAAGTTPRTYYDASASGIASLYSTSELVSVLLVLLIIIVQFVFILYFCVRIFLKPGKAAG